MKSAPGKDMPKLDDYYLFLAVADAGGLSGAEKATGTSLPTLSRRMAELERTLGKRLFERGPRGYTLTADGRALQQEAEVLREAATRLCRFQLRETAPEVRITAGGWTTRYIARHLSEIWTPDSPWRPALLASNSNVDIARREADIGIRNRRPEQSWLAGREIMGLMQVSPEIDALTHDEWLVTHHDARHDPPVRAALEALAGLLMSEERFG